MINFAHRGASQYAPENTMVSFRMGIQMGANGIETDVQKSKDGVLVLFHDESMKRVLSIDGKICDYTWDELKDLDAGSFKDEKYKGEKLVRLEDFLIEFGSSGIKLAIEIKQRGVEEETLAMLRHYAEDEDFTITSFIFDSISSLASDKHAPQLGFLSKSYSDELISQLKDMGIVEYCPEAAFVSEEIVRKVKNAGLRVRPWGIKDVGLMNKMVDLDVYGMTVNFPDLLSKRLADLYA